MTFFTSFTPLHHMWYLLLRDNLSFSNNFLWTHKKYMHIYLSYLWKNILKIIRSTEFQRIFQCYLFMHLNILFKVSSIGSRDINCVKVICFLKIPINPFTMAKSWYFKKADIRKMGRPYTVLVCRDWYINKCIVYVYIHDSL